MGLLLREHKEGLGLKTSSFKAQGVLDISIFSWVFQHPVVALRVFYGCPVIFDSE
jgi:hypothetical protein